MLVLMDPMAAQNLSLPIRKMEVTRPSLRRLFRVKVTTVDQKPPLLLLAVTSSSKRPMDYSEEVDIDNPENSVN